MATGLTIMQQKFVEALFANGRNAPAACRAAGYTGTPQSIRVQAHRLLTNANVALHVRARLEAQGVTSDRIIAETAIVAFLPIDHEIFKRKEFDKFGGLKAESVDLNPKLTALRDLGKYAGMGRDTEPHTTTNILRIIEYAPPKGYELTARLLDAGADTDDAGEASERDA